jgi:hypothetical protein|tara:strand:- start:138 stop:299 length:162 start_codon:yes stop_codon:yes gene_type:complete
LGHKANPGGYIVLDFLKQTNPKLDEMVTTTHTGQTWFFPGKKAKERAVNLLLK